MSKTKRDIITMALNKLGVVGVGESVQIEDYTTAEPVFDSMFARLVKNNKIWFTSPENIPIEASDPIAAILSGLLTSEFRVSDSEIAKAERNHDKGFGDLFEMQGQEPVQSAESYYF